MARDFTKQDMIDLSNEIAPVLTKLNKCYNYKNRFQKELSEILCSDDISFSAGLCRIEKKIILG